MWQNLQKFNSQETLNLGKIYFILPRSFLTQHFQKFHQSTGWSASHARRQIFHIAGIMHNSSYVQVHPIFASHKFLKRNENQLIKSRSIQSPSDLIWYRIFKKEISNQIVPDKKSILVKLFQIGKKILDSQSKLVVGSRFWIIDMLKS